MIVAGIVQLGFDPAREERELREYLGSAFRRERLWEHEQQLDAEFAALKDERAFYRSSTAYLYDLTAFAMTGTKVPYLQELTQQLRPPARLLDYGCGIGSDGLLLLEAGYRVAFADFQNPSVEYLRWRLAKRGLAAPIHDLDLGVPAGFDAAFAFDVIEHVEDPFALLHELEHRARLVEVNFLEHEPGVRPLHHDLPVTALLRHVAARRLRFYRVLHGRSHLVLYEPGAASGAGRLLNRSRIAARRARQRAGRAARRPRRADHRATRRPVDRDPLDSGQPPTGSAEAASPFRPARTADGAPD
jgi:SAM-dependent methyltransferase